MELLLFVIWFTEPPSTPVQEGSATEGRELNEKSHIDHFFIFWWMVVYLLQRPTTSKAQHHKKRYVVCNKEQQSIHYSQCTTQSDLDNFPGHKQVYYSFDTNILNLFIFHIVLISSATFLWLFNLYYKYVGHLKEALLWEVGSYLIHSEENSEGEKEHFHKSQLLIKLLKLLCANWNASSS